MYPPAHGRLFNSRAAHHPTAGRGALAAPILMPPPERSAGRVAGAPRRPWVMYMCIGVYPQVSSGVVCSPRACRGHLPYAVERCCCEPRSVRLRIWRRELVVCVRTCIHRIPHARVRLAQLGGDGPARMVPPGAGGGAGWAQHTHLGRRRHVSSDARPAGPVSPARRGMLLAGGPQQRNSG